MIFFGLDYNPIGVYSILYDSKDKRRNKNIYQNVKILYDEQYRKAVSERGKAENVYPGKAEKP